MHSHRRLYRQGPGLAAASADDEVTAAQVWRIEVRDDGSPFIRISAETWMLVPVEYTIFFMVNATSKKRLYAQARLTGGDGVGAYAGEEYDDQRWRSVPVFPALSAGPVCTPSLDTAQEVIVVNSYSRRRLCNDARHIGACSEHEDLTGDQVWQLEVGNGSSQFLEVLNDKWILKPSGDTFFIVDTRNNRRLYAQKDKTGHDGCGAFGEEEYDDQRWYLNPAFPAPSLQNAHQLLGFKLLIDERFEDFKNWNFEEGWIRNREDQCYLPQNASLQADGLTISALRGQPPTQYPAPVDDKRRPVHGGGWTSASLVSKSSFCFGLVEVEAQIDACQGFWPAIWTTGAVHVDGVGWPHSGEIDIMEYYKGNILSNVLWGKHSPTTSQRYQAAHLGKATNISRWPDGKFGGFCTWRLLWLPDSLEIWLDNSLHFKCDVNMCRNPSGSNPFHVPHRLRLNLAVGGNCGGNPAGAQSSHFKVRSVRVWGSELSL